MQRRQAQHIFSPSSSAVGSKTIAQWDFSDLGTITLGVPEYIAKVADKSGNGHDFSQEVPALRPRSVIHGGMYFAFFAANHHMTSPYAASLNPQVFDLFIVAERYNAPAFYPALISAAEMDSQHKGYRCGGDPANHSMRSVFSSALYDTFVWSPSNSFPEYTTVIYNMAVYWENANLFAKSTINNAFPSPVENITGKFDVNDSEGSYMGGRENPDGYFTGFIKEIIMKKPLTEPDRLNMYRYLANKWGVSIA